MSDEKRDDSPRTPPAASADRQAQQPQRASPAELAPLPRWAETLVRLLDDGLKIPGTKGIGLDALIGLIFPGAGDVATGLGSLGLFVLAFRERVPPVILLRMMLNIAVDIVAGSFPIVGDFFDLVWRSNRKNIELIRQYRDPEREPTTADYLVVAAALGLAAFSIALPILLFILLGTGLLGLLLGDGT